jgi:hypothetical protein
VAVRVLQTLHQVASGGIPDTHALVQRTGSDVVAVGRHGNRGDAILNAEGVDELAVKNIPKTHGLVSTARSDVTSVVGEVEGVDILLVTAEDILDGARGNIPDLQF